MPASYTQAELGRTYIRLEESLRFELYGDVADGLGTMIDATEALLTERDRLAAEVERLKPDATLGAAARKLPQAEWDNEPDGGPALVYCYWRDWDGDEEIHPLGFGVSSIYYSDGDGKDYGHWFRTPEEALAAAGLLMEPADGEVKP